MDGLVDSMDMSLHKPRERVKDREAWSPRGCKESDATERLSNSNTGADKRARVVRARGAGRRGDTSGFGSAPNA